MPSHIKTKALVALGSCDPTHLLRPLENDRAETVIGQHKAAVKPAGPPPITMTFE